MDDVPGLAAHSERVAKLAGFLAERLGLDDATVGLVSQAAVLHDIGKLDIPSSILHKPAALTPEERAYILRHPELGADRLHLGRDGPVIELAAQIAVEHHEYFDGSGYPYHLKGEEISLPGRVVTLADVYDALRSPRDYKPGLSHEAVCGMIFADQGRTRSGQFDPRLLDVLRREGESLSSFYESLYPTLH
jgi:putative nucleotidyltransferase with HDIG domain